MAEEEGDRGGDSKRVRQESDASGSGNDDYDDDDGSVSSERQSELLSQVTIGTKVAIYWPDDDEHYPGTVAAHHPNDWQYHVYTVNYDDGESEALDLSIERFRVTGGVRRSRPKCRSLTVRFDEHRETWRSPPTYYGGDDFDWPGGWIEVQRLAEASEQEDDGAGREQSADGAQPLTIRKNGERRQWVREFHPPPRAGRGGGRAAKVCRSMEEVRRHVEQQRAGQLKQERLAARRKKREDENDPSSRRSSGRRKTSVIPLSSPLVHRVGAQSELHKIMKGGGRPAARMRQSILLGAVLGRKKGILETESGFLGADGRMYPDLRKAFGKYSVTKQCSLCKARVQGNWYCRITHGHLDKPDYDGGNSVDKLVELFRHGVEELEGRLRNLLPGGKKKGGLSKKGSASVGFEGTGWSMNLLSEDLLYQIASFLPSLSQLASFCKTCRRGQHLLHGSVHSEKLFRGTFLRAFGERGTKGNFERDLTWRERWSMSRDLRRGLARKRILPPGAVSRRLRETVGVLSPQDERDAISYDNPGYGDPERAYCNGYFAMEILHLPPPPNAGPDWQPPIIVRGDYHGVKIFGSAADLYRDESSDGGGSSLNLPTTVGADEGGGQVLSLIHCDVTAASLRANGGCQPCCFIGDASGRVAAVSAALAPGGSEYAFAVSGRHHAHESEVTDMAFVDCGAGRPVLFSACCAGRVYFYPDALDPDRNFSMEESVLAFSNFYDCPIFSLASAVVRPEVGGDRSFSVLCTGDRDGNIRVWLKPDGDLEDLRASASGQKFRHVQLYKSSTHRGTGYHLVTRAMFVGDDNLLITGTNNGDVRFWQLQCAEDSSKAIGKGPLPSLTLRYDLMGIHNGAVELLMNVGDVLLTCGGNDGKILGWDISTGLRLGSVQCHPGRRIEEGGGDILYSCVVDLLMSGKDGSIISLCRDGSLRQFKMM